MNHSKCSPLVATTDTPQACSETTIPKRLATIEDASGEFRQAAFEFRRTEHRVMLPKPAASFDSTGLRLKKVGARGFEPRTSALSELRSNQLSYAPEAFGD